MSLPSAINDSRPAVASSAQGLGWTRLRRGLWNWCLRGDLLSDVLSDANLLREGRPDSTSLEFIKQGQGRRVERATLPSGAYICKFFETTNWRARARAILRGSPALWEASRFQLAETHGVAAPELMGVGEFQPRSTWGWRSIWNSWFGRRTGLLLTKLIPAAVPLSNFRPNLGKLPAAWTVLVDHRTSLCTAVGKLLGDVHGQGLSHSDLHAGNILVRHEAGRWTCWLVDLAALRKGPGTLSAQRACAELAMLDLSLRPFTTRADRRRFFLAYRDCLAQRQPEFLKQLGHDPVTQSQTAERLVHGEFARILAQADKAWRRGNSRSRAIPSGRCLTLMSEQTAADFSANPETWWLREGRLHPRQRLVRCEQSPASRRMHAAREAWYIGHQLVRRGVPTVTPLAYLDTAAFGFLLTLAPEGTLPLDELLESLQAARRVSAPLPEVTACSLRMAQVLAKLAAAGYRFESIHIDDFVVTPDGDWCGVNRLERLVTDAKVVTRSSVDDWRETVDHLLRTHLPRDGSSEHRRHAA